MESEMKKYTIMENVINKINQKFVTIPENERKRNRSIMDQVIDVVINKMCTIDPLFKLLFERKSYAGSVYDNLKISQAEEFDIDVLLKLPFDFDIIVSDKPGFVKVQAKYDEFLRSSKSDKFRDVRLQRLLVDDYLCANKLLKWMDALFAKTVNELKANNEKSSIVVLLPAENDPVEHTLSFTISNNAPAFTIKLNGCIDGEAICIHIDFVPSFKFCDTHWPQPDYRENPSKVMKTFLIVPKLPVNETDGKYWRLSFQEQERELLRSPKFNRLKPALRLMKKFRDKLQHEQIASYYIKTVFLWEIECRDKKTYWGKPLSYVFMESLKKYYGMISDGNIPYYWNKNFNLLSDVNETTLMNIRNRLKRIINEVENNPLKIAKYLVSEKEFTSIKDEIELGKKHSNAINVSMLSLASSNDSGYIEEPEKFKQTQISLEELNDKIDNIYEIVRENHQMTKMLLKMCSDLSNRVEHLENTTKNHGQKDIFDPISELLDAGSFTANCVISNELQKPI